MTLPPKPGPDYEKEFCQIGPSGHVAQVCPALLVPRSRQQHSCSWMGPPPTPSMLALARKASLKIFHPCASSWGGKDLAPRVVVVRFASFPGASSGIATCCRLGHRGARAGTAAFRFPDWPFTNCVCRGGLSGSTARVLRPAAALRITGWVFPGPGDAFPVPVL